MTERVLIAYASKSGTAAEVAEEIGRVLRDRGLAVDVCPAGTVASLDGYHAVVLGSGVRVGAWLPEALRFAECFAAELSSRPVALFTMHFLARDDSAESRAQRARFTAPVHARLTPVAEAWFAGRIDLSRLSWLERLMTKMVKAPEADACDWDAIRAWAEALPEM